jgi:hypothetical protein
MTPWITASAVSGACGMALRGSTSKFMIAHTTAPHAMPVTTQ